MSIPVNRLKLLAFVFGAAVAGFDGRDLRHGRRRRRSPATYDVGLLITIYAIVILGGSGSLMGVVVGGHHRQQRSRAAARSSSQARVALLRRRSCVAILVKVRPWRLLAAVARRDDRIRFRGPRDRRRGVSALVHGEVDPASGALAHAVDHWMLFPSNPEKIADFAYVLLDRRDRSSDRSSARRLASGRCSCRLLYLVTFVWENLLSSRRPARRGLLLLGRAARRADERPAAGPVRHRDGWRSSDGAKTLLELQGVDKSFGGLTRDRRPRPRTSTRTRSSA